MRIGFIGTGNMGGAILKGYANSSASDGNEILIHNKLTKHNAVMGEAMHECGDTRFRICNDNEDLAEQSDIIIIAYVDNTDFKKAGTLTMEIWGIPISEDSNGEYFEYGRFFEKIYFNDFEEVKEVI